MRPHWGKEHAQGGLSLPLATASKRAVSQGWAFTGNRMAGIGGCLILGGPHPGLESRLSSSHAHAQIAKVPDQDHETSRTSLARSDKAETPKPVYSLAGVSGPAVTSSIPEVSPRVPKPAKPLAQDSVRTRHRN